MEREDRREDGRELESVAQAMAASAGSDRADEARRALESYPWVILEGEETAHETLQEAMQAYADSSSWEDSIGYTVPMVAQPCRPVTSQEMAGWLAADIWSRLPEMILEQDVWWYDDLDVGPPDHPPQELEGQLAKILLPYMETILPTAASVYGDRIRITAEDWAGYGLIVDDDGMLRGLLDDE